MSNRLSIITFENFTYESLVELAREVGFDGVHSGSWSAESAEGLFAYKKMTAAAGLDFDSAHSTIAGCAGIWVEGEQGDRYTEKLLGNIDNVAAVGVKNLVVHVQLPKHSEPSFELGVKRLELAVERAAQKQVRIAFENINGAELLFRTLDHFDMEHVGFCYDVGHAHCYTPDARYLDRVGDRLFCTHIHDNDGASDLHLLPFDSAVDFDRLARELASCGYSGDITLEVNYAKYADRLSKREYMQRAFDSVMKLQTLIKKYGGE